MTNIHILNGFILASLYFASQGTGEKSLDIDIQVIFVNETFVKLQCVAERRTLLCGTTFHFNNKTIEELKWENSTCFHTTAECKSEKCTCDHVCKTFALNFTIPENNDKHIFGCSARFNNSNTYYKSKVAKEYNSTGHPLNKDNEQLEISTIRNLDEVSDPFDLNTTYALISIIVVETLGIGALVFFIGYKQLHKSNGMNSCTKKHVDSMTITADSNETDPFDPSALDVIQEEDPDDGKWNAFIR